MAATSCLFLITGECLTDDDIGPLSELIILGVHAWDSSSLGFDINEELKTFVSSNPSPQSFNEDEKGESVIRVFSDRLCVAALINPGLFTLASQLEWLLQTPFTSRHLVFAGRQSEELGDWLLKDASVSPARLAQMLRSAPDASLPPDHKFSVSCPTNAAGGAAWKAACAKPPLTEFRAHAAAQLADLDQATVPGAVQLAGFLASKQCGLASVEQRLRPAGTVGNIRIGKPTLYVFPAGLGDSCYLGVDGFGLLVNTGAARTPAFWPFLAHLDRVDGLLLSHWDHDNLPGLLDLLERLSAKDAAAGVPSIGCALLPCRPREAPAAAAGAADSTAPNGGNGEQQRHHLEASVRRDAGTAMRLIRCLGVPVEDVHRRPQSGQPHPMTLYCKLGHGSLDLYPLQPLPDAKEFKEFAAQLQAAAAGKPWPLARVGSAHVSQAHANSLCCLLVWKPADPKQPWTRLLLPGCCPQLRVIEGLASVRGLDCLKSPEYSPAAAAAAAKHASASAGAAAKKPTAAAAADKPARPASAATAAARKQPIVKKPVATAGEPKAAAAAKSAGPVTKSSVSASKSTAAAGRQPAAAKAAAPAAAKAAAPAAAKAPPTKAATGAAPKAAAPPAKAAAAASSAKKTTTSTTPRKPAAGDKAAAATAAPAKEPTLPVTEQLGEEAAGKIEEILLNASPAAADGDVAGVASAEHQQQQQHHQEAWGDLNSNNTNSAEADTAELVNLTPADGGDDAGAAAAAAQLMQQQEHQQPLALPAPAPPPSQPKGSGGSISGRAGGKSSAAGAAAAAVNYGPLYPLHFDLAYVPGHGERQYADAEYFKRVRARYYVLSSCDPQPHLLEALLEGKVAWPEQETTLVPTHSNHLVTAWAAGNAERLQQLHVTLAPSASMCRIKLQNEEDKICTAYRVEF